jgi:hypothetical protein
MREPIFLAFVDLGALFFISVATWVLVRDLRSGNPKPQFLAHGCGMSLRRSWDWARQCRLPARRSFGGHRADISYELLLTSRSRKPAATRRRRHRVGGVGFGVRYACSKSVHRSTSSRTAGTLAVIGSSSAEFNLTTIMCKNATIRYQSLSELSQNRGLWITA